MNHTASSHPKAGSSADLRVANNEGPVASIIGAIAEAQGHQEELIDRLERVLGKVIVAVPEDGADNGARPSMETDLNEALQCRLERQQGLNNRLAFLLDRIRL